MTSDESSLDDLFGRFIVEDAASGGGHRREPFKFLDPYDRDDGDIFFGRDEEAAELYRRFHLSSPLLVYGQSGTGKTSLIRCGLLARIPPEDALPVMARLGALPVADLTAALAGAGAEGEGPAAMVADLRERNHKPLILILDQFEEPFILASREERERLFSCLAEIARFSGGARILIAMREEYIARLAELEPFLPSLFANRMRLERIRRGAAARLITGPCAVAGVGIDEALADNILDTLTKEGEIELSYLQVYADKLWRSAMARDAAHPAILEADVAVAGDIGDVLGAFLEERLAAMSDGEACRKALKACVTAEGTRRAVGPTELAVAIASDGRIDLEAAIALARRLAGERILREREGGGEWELRHDSLAARISSWLSAAEKEYVEVEHALRQRLVEYRARGFLLDARFLGLTLPHERKLCLDPEFRELVDRSRRELRKRRRTRVSVLSGAAFLLIAALSALSIWAMQSRALAIRNEAKAERNRLAAFGSAAEAEKNAERAEASALQARANADRAESNERKALAQQRMAEAERAWAERLSENLRRESKMNDTNAKGLLSWIIDQSNALLDKVSLEDNAEEAINYVLARADAYAQHGDPELAIKDYQSSQPYLSDYGRLFVNNHIIYENFVLLRPREAIALADEYIREFEAFDPARIGPTEQAWLYTVHINRSISEAMIGAYDAGIAGTALALEALEKSPKEQNYYCTVFDQFIRDETGKTKIDATRDEMAKVWTLFATCVKIFSGRDIHDDLATIAKAAPSYSETLYLFNLAWFQKEYRPSDYGALGLRFYLWRRFIDTSPARRAEDPAAGLYAAFMEQHRKLRDPRYDDLAAYLDKEYGKEYR
jgi:hypothetical protein